jgi:glutamine synthetase adenylyltransferase
LLISPSQLAAYCAQEAQSWEALTFSKLRFLAGSQSVSTGAFDAANGLFRRFASDARFVGDVRDMRVKLQSADAAEKNFKTSSGGIYDIDFLCAFLLVQYNVPDKRGTLRDRLWRCAELDLLKKTDAAQLDHATELFRTVDHVLRLVAGRPCKWLPPSGHVKNATEALTPQILQREFPNGLETELEDARHGVHRIYENVLGKT